MTVFHLIAFPGTLSPKIAILGVGASTYEFGGQTSSVARSTRHQDGVSEFKQLGKQS